MTYEKIANDSRKKVLELVFRAQTSHIGSLFSCADIMAVLFEKIDLDKDKFVLSKGWAAAMLYYHLWRKGRITEEELNSYCQDGSKFIGLAEPVCKDIVIAGGSMGLGLPGAVGLALAKKLKGEEGKVYCLMSDGELQCGTTWEAALIAAQHKLDNLIVIIDNNGWQAMGKTEEILPKNLPFKGWVGINAGSESEKSGNDPLVISECLRELESQMVDAPGVINAHTTKGKGWKRAENNNLYHYKQLSEDEYLEALSELNA